MNQFAFSRPVGYFQAEENGIGFTIFLLQAFLYGRMDALIAAPMLNDVAEITLIIRLERIFPSEFLRLIVLVKLKRNAADLHRIPEVSVFELGQEKAWVELLLAEYEDAMHQDDNGEDEPDDCVFSFWCGHELLLDQTCKSSIIIGIGNLAGHEAAKVQKNHQCGLDLYHIHSSR